MINRANNPRLYRTLVLLVCSASIMLFVSRLHYGFLPEDDPAFADLGERTLHGELPNVDFYDNYTGGASYLDALALRLFGARIVSLRYMLLIFYIAWVPTIYYLTSRLTSFITALIVTALAATWSVPVYPAAYATWYNLYFATFGLAALFRYIETKRQRYLFLTGLCGGVSFLAKIFGLYFVAAVGLFLLFDEQNEHPVCHSRRQIKDMPYLALLTSLLLIFMAALIELIDSAGDAKAFAIQASRYYHFVVPAGAICVLLIYREWNIASTSFRDRIVRVCSRIIPFCVGVVFPILLFLAPYLRRHAVSKWFTSLLLSSARVRLSTNPPPANVLMLLAVPLLFVLLLNAEVKQRLARRAATILVASCLCLLLVCAHGRPLISALVWFSIVEALPFIVVASVIVLFTLQDGYGQQHRLLMVLACVLSMVSLVQFPFAAPMYFFFIAPILFLTFLALAEHNQVSTGYSSPILPLFVFYFSFGLWMILPAQFYISEFGRPPQAVLDLPRAEGFTADRQTVELYREVVPEIVRHAGGYPIYAGPDSPGLYFLTALRNPTPIYMDFTAGKDAQPSNILAAIDLAGVKTAVINHGEFKWGPSSYNPSGPPPPELLNGLRQRFPHSEVIGFYEIRWK
jgi:hypothetical protein